MPTERSYAVHNTRQFMYDLLDKKKTPGVSKLVREQARRLLRHFPATFYLNTCSKSCPDIFGHIEAKLDHEVEWDNMVALRKAQEEQVITQENVKEKLFEAVKESVDLAKKINKYYRSKRKKR